MKNDEIFGLSLCLDKNKYKKLYLLKILLPESYDSGTTIYKEN